MSYRDTYVYFIQHNFKDLENGQEIIDKLKRSNEIAIRFGSLDEKNSVSKYLNNGDTKKLHMNVSRWITLLNLLKANKKVLVVSQYKNESITYVGYIDVENSKLDINSTEEIQYLKLNDVRPFKDSIEFQVFNHLIANNTTISPIKKKEKLIYHLYHGISSEDISGSINDYISDVYFEILCKEYLEKLFASNGSTLITPIGGISQYFDILLKLNDENKTIIAAQVSNTNSKDLLLLKAENIAKINVDKYFLFGDLDELNCENEEGKEITFIPIKNVISEIKNPDLTGKIIPKINSIYNNSFNETADCGLPTADQTKTTNA
jgi:hypothetical protein